MAQRIYLEVEFNGSVRSQLRSANTLKVILETEEIAESLLGKIGEITIVDEGDPDE